MLEHFQDSSLLSSAELHIEVLLNLVHGQLLPKDELTHYNSTEDHTVNLAVKAVDCAAMAREGRGEIFDTICSFSSWSQEPSKRADQWCREAKNDTIQLSGHALDIAHSEWQLISFLKIDWVDLITFVVAENTDIVLEGAADPIISAQRFKHESWDQKSLKNIAKHSANKAFPGFVWRKWNQLVLAKGLAYKVGHSVIGCCAKLREVVHEAAEAGQRSEHGSWTAWNRADNNGEAELGKLIAQKLFFQGVEGHNYAYRKDHTEDMPIVDIKGLVEKGVIALSDTWHLERLVVAVSHRKGRPQTQHPESVLNVGQPSLVVSISFSRNL